MSRSRVLGIFAILSLAASCLSAPTESAPATVIVRGEWSYASVQSGNATTANGTLVLSQDSTVRFSGTLDANETDDRGQLRRVLSIVSGRTIDASLVDFDVVVDPTVTRRHTGSARGDSLTGNWIEVSAGGIAASGTFRAHRVRAQ